MGSITPRWEWRTFDRSFGDVEVRLRTSPARRRDSVDTYIVSNQTNTNTKVRDDTLDVKALQDVDSHGLELWLPVMKSAFPLSPGTLVQAFDAWGLKPPTLADRAWTLPAFLTEIVRTQSALTAVAVTKTRYGSVIDDCLVEIADLTLDGTPIRTVAVEMADPARVWRTVEALGLSARENVNYVKALKRHLTPGRAQL